MTKLCASLAARRDGSVPKVSAESERNECRFQCVFTKRLQYRLFLTKLCGGFSERRICMQSLGSIRENPVVFLTFPQQKKIHNGTPLANDPARRWRTIRHAAPKRSAMPLPNETRRKSTKIGENQIFRNRPQSSPMASHAQKTSRNARKPPKT